MIIDSRVSDATRGANGKGPFGASFASEYSYQCGMFTLMKTKFVFSGQPLEQGCAEVSARTVGAKSRGCWVDR